MSAVRRASLIAIGNAYGVKMGVGDGKSLAMANDEGASRRVPCTTCEVLVATGVSRSEIERAHRNLSVPHAIAGDFLRQLAEVEAATLRECEGCGQWKPAEEMSTVFLPGAGETYQCEQCR